MAALTPNPLCDLRPVAPSPGLSFHLQGAMLLDAGQDRPSDVIKLVGGFRKKVPGSSGGGRHLGGFSSLSVTSQGLSMPSTLWGEPPTPGRPPPPSLLKVLLV